MSDDGRDDDHDGERVHVRDRGWMPIYDACIDAPSPDATDATTPSSYSY